MANPGHQFGNNQTSGNKPKSPPCAQQAERKRGESFLSAPNRQKESIHATGKEEKTRSHKEGNKGEKMARHGKSQFCLVLST